MRPAFVSFVFVGIGLSVQLATSAADNYRISTIASANGGPGHRDGPAASAQFQYPAGVDRDASGNLYVADRENDVIRRIAPNGNVTTVAGSPGQRGNADGVGSAARFSAPQDVAVAPDGSLYVANSYTYPAIRRIAADGSVTTVVSAGLTAPAALDFGSDGTLYIADSTRNQIFKLTGGNTLTLVAGGGGTGSADGNGAAALFNSPRALHVTDSGEIYVADTANHTIRRISSSGAVTTFAGAAGVAGRSGGDLGSARFNSPTGVAVDAAGNVYVADSGNELIWRITPGGTVAEYAGGGYYNPLTEPNFADGSGTNARFDAPGDLAIDSSGRLFVVDVDNHAVRRVGTDAAVVTLAGSPSRAATGTVQPTGVALTPEGDALVSLTGDGTIVRVSPTGVITPFAGTSGNTGLNRTIDATREHFFASGIAVDSAGNVYAPANHAIRKLRPDGTVEIVAGSLTEIGSADGAGTAARFNYPQSLAVDSHGNLFVADYWNFTIRRITPAGVVSTFAGQAGDRASVDGQGTAARFGLIHGLVIDDNDVLWVGSASTIRKITPDGTVTTVAGDYLNGNTSGYWDATGTAARFSGMLGLGLDGRGNLLIADQGNHAIRLMDSATAVSTLAGGNGIAGLADGLGSQARFNQPSGVLAFANGNVLIADTANNRLRLGVPAERIDPVITWSSPILLRTGDPLSSVQLNATSDVAGYFTYVPAAGTILPEGSHVVTANFTPLDTNTYGTARATATVVVTAQSIVLGTYFGQTDSGDPWSLWVQSPTSGVLQLDLAGTDSALVAPVTIGPDGTFSGSGTEVRPVGTPESARTTSVTGAITTAGIGDLRVTGSLPGLGVTLTGAFPRTGEGIVFSGNYFTAVALGAARGSVRAAVGYSGDVLAIIVLSDRVDSARGVLDADGRAELTTADGALLTMKIDPAGRTLEATLAVPTAATMTTLAQRATPRLPRAMADELTTIRFAGLAAGVAPTNRLSNLSVRSRSGSGDETLIMGFVVVGSNPKSILVRGIGPGLTELGVSGALADPRLRIFAQAEPTVPLFENDDWQGESEVAAVGDTLGAFPLTTTSRDAAVLVSLPQGQFTAQVSATDNTRGIALIETYDADSARDTRFINVSARTVTGAGDDVLTAGFVIAGDNPTQLLVRGVGPSLAALGVSGTIADPVLRVFDRDGGLVAENNDWGGDPEVVAIADALGAFELTGPDSADAAMIVTLQPGLYSVQVATADPNAPGGVALVELYELPDP